MLWLNFRLNKLSSNSPEKLVQKRLQEQEKQAEIYLQGIAEPSIVEELPSGGKLWLKPQEGKFSGEVRLEVWVQSSKLIKKVDLKLFYPQDLLELNDPFWQVVRPGLATWSSEDLFQDRLDPPAGGEPGAELLTEVSFRIIKEGEAQIDFDFNKESLLDCNLWDENGEDVLEGVENAYLKIVL